MVIRKNLSAAKRVVNSGIGEWQYPESIFKMKIFSQASSGIQKSTLHEKIIPTLIDVKPAVLPSSRTQARLNVAG